MPPKRMNLMPGKYLLFGTSMISYISVKRELDNTINIQVYIIGLLFIV